MIAQFMAILRARIALGVRGVALTGRTKLEGGFSQLRIDGKLSVGHSVRLRRLQTPVQVTVGPNGSVELGDHVTFNQGVNIWSEQRITIGAHTLICDLIAINDTAAHQATPGSLIHVAPISIGRNVWISRNAVIFPRRYGRRSRRRGRWIHSDEGRSREIAGRWEPCDRAEDVRGAGHRLDPEVIVTTRQAA